MPSVLAEVLTSTQWLGAVAAGLCYAGAVLGVFLTFRILAFPDLTIEGSFPLGAGVAALFLVQGWSQWLSLIPAFVMGALAGMLTAWLATRLRINGLLASIIVALGLYSINLRLLGLGTSAHTPTANLPIPVLGAPSVERGVQPWLAGLAGRCLAPGACINDAYVTYLAQTLVFLMIAAVLVGLLYWLLNTEFGLALRAVGDNEQMVRAQGTSVPQLKLLGLALSNGLIALSGALIVARFGYAEVNLGRGLIIIGLAAVIIGEVLVGARGLLSALIGVVVGSVVYRLCITLALNHTRSIGLQETDLQLLTAAIVVVALALPQLRRWIIPRRGLA
ncbi:ABC transporter permease [Kallotenue papyrolyticum]|uniref:ABC transporter permease n=1 Tax=Kallotenue papyrolyticum TaxID=1325125 RepID=UPI0006932D34|nr:ABC transporter permease [Kallotenue papyrolyticum]